MKKHTNKKLGRVLGVAVAAATGLVGSEARADVPALVTHQGRLFDAGGVPIVGPQDVKFTIYDSEMSGVELWTETINIDFDEGYFSVRLGEQATLDAAVFDGSTRWMGITVGADQEMTPKAAVASVPYAMFAGDVRGVINPVSINIEGFGPVIDQNGEWVGPQIVGTPGPAGPAGPAGVAGGGGPAGPEGPAGVAGAVGPDGPTGDVGPVGPVGPAGPAGLAGPAGQDGDVGPMGPDGPVGPAGPDGSPGPQGPAGSNGPVGPDGPVGPQGPVGNIGPAGPDGPQGPPGVDGAVGPQGPDGPQGPAGMNGAVGPQGPSGPQGPAGMNGAMGMPGPQGPVGPPGPDGAVGPKGPNGAVGPVGPAGAMGLQGPAGTNGTNGVNGIKNYTSINEFSATQVFGVGVNKPWTMTAANTTIVGVTAGQRLTGAGATALVLLVAGKLQVDLCYQLGNNPMVPFSATSTEFDFTGLPGSSRVPVGFTGSTIANVSGNLVVGLCVKTTTGSFNNSSSAKGWIEVINP